MARTELRARLSATTSSSSLLVFEHLRLGETLFLLQGQHEVAKFVAEVCDEVLLALQDRVQTLRVRVDVVLFALYLLQQPAYYML